MKVINKQTSKNKKHWAMFFLFLFLCVSSTQLYADERPILEMTSYSSKLLKPDLTPNFSIYADGVIEIYQPIYMKNSGLFSGQLSEEQLNDVINMMNSLEQFDSVEAEEKYYEAELENSRLNNELYYSSETVITIFKINSPDSLDSDEKLIVAENAQEKSARFNNLVGWKKIADAENMIKALNNSLTLTRIGEAK